MPVKKVSKGRNHKRSTALPAAQELYTGLRVFISHDSRDAELAKGFGELIAGASAGLLKSFWSSDTSGQHGLEYGAEWYGALMTQLNQASAVVCLLTSFSAERPWLLYEAGVAKGRQTAPVYGVALGIPLSIASTGPFAQLQNCGDDVESLTSLAVQLIKLVPEADPRREAVAMQVRAFKDNVAKLLEDPSRLAASEPRRRRDSRGHREAFRRDQGTGCPACRTAGWRAGASTGQSGITPADHVQCAKPNRNALGFLIVINLLRDDFPWLYDLGMRMWSEKEEKKYERRRRVL